jgi:hypothetical protein
MAVQNTDVDIISLHDNHGNGLTHRVNHSTQEEGEFQGRNDTQDDMQRWDLPRVNIPRVLATFWCFLLLGANDSLYGVRIDSLLILCRFTNGALFRQSSHM